MMVQVMRLRPLFSAPTPTGPVMSTVQREVAQDGLPPRDGDGSPGVTFQGDGHVTLRRQLHQQLLAALASRRGERLNEQELRQDLFRLAGELSGQNDGDLESHERESLVEQVLTEVFGYRPIEAHVRDTAISDVLNNGAR